MGKNRCQSLLLMMITQLDHYVCVCVRLFVSWHMTMVNPLADVNT